MPDQSELIHLQVVVLKIMPPGHPTQLSDDERGAFGPWFAAARARGAW